MPEKLFHDLHPWGKISVDLIGPWSVQLRGQQMQFHAIIEDAIGIAESYPHMWQWPLSIITYRIIHAHRGASMITGVNLLAKNLGKPFSYMVFDCIPQRL